MTFKFLLLKGLISGIKTHQKLSKGKKIRESATL